MVIIPFSAVPIQQINLLTRYLAHPSSSTYHNHSLSFIHCYAIQYMFSAGKTLFSVVVVVVGALFSILQGLNRHLLTNLLMYFLIPSHFPIALCD